jgi:hypothetical protein
MPRYLGSRILAATGLLLLATACLAQVSPQHAPAPPAPTGAQATAPPAQPEGAPGSAPPPSSRPVQGAIPSACSTAPQAGEIGATQISGLLHAPSGDAIKDDLALNDKLAIELDRAPAHPADQYVLFVNDIEVRGLGPATYTALTNSKCALVFKLVRNSDNSVFWKNLLGAPEHWTVPVRVALGVRAEPCKTSEPCKSPDITLRGATGSFNFEVVSWLWLIVAVIAVGLVVFVVFGHARHSTTLRDNLLPQLPPERQPYSLARCQMAFWFVLIFAAFIFLYILLWDYNTVSSQALTLMGISGATALAAVAVDIAKDSPADAANRALQALGLNTYADVLRVQQEQDALRPQAQAADTDYQTKNVSAVAAEAAAAAAPANAQLAQAATAARGLANAAKALLQQQQTQVQDRENILRTYRDKSGAFASTGIWNDITTDLNGPTVHRIQVVCWTVILGGVFIVGVYRDLAMPPDFSPTLLALMGLSSAGYVGFKYSEKNN